MSDLAASADEVAAGRTGPAGSSTAQFGVIVFLASDVMLFAPFFAAYFLLRSTTDPWPPDGVELAVGRTAVATAVLVASSFTMIAVRPCRRAARRAAGDAALAAGHDRARRVVPRQPDRRVRHARLPRRRPPLRLDLLAAHRPPRRSRHRRARRAGAAVRSLGAGALHDALASWAEGVSLFWHLVDIIWVFVFTTIWVLQ